MISKSTLTVLLLKFSGISTSQNSKTPTQKSEFIFSEVSSRSGDLPCKAESKQTI